MKPFVSLVTHGLRRLDLLVRLLCWPVLAIQLQVKSLLEDLVSFGVSVSTEYVALDV